MRFYEKCVKCSNFREDEFDGCDLIPYCRVWEDMDSFEDDCDEYVEEI